MDQDSDAIKVISVLALLAHLGMSKRLAKKKGQGLNKIFHM
jgi:sulfur transfer protein SufE